jgi:serine/threonine-protein kinase
MTAVPAAFGPEYLPRDTVIAKRYRIVREIGRGGYSVVYEARDQQLRSPVAVKLLVAPPSSAALARERLKREASAIRNLSHPNIVTLFDYVEEGPWNLLVMELVTGSDLATRIADAGPLDPAEVRDIGIAVASALQAAHEQGILHRDVKPQNILIDDSGQAKLVDFGSAKLEDRTGVTHTGGIVGTLAYTPPELLRDRRGDARSDVYSLGMTLHYALTGSLPGAGSPHLPPEASPAGHRPGDLDGTIPEWLSNAVARATAESPSSRFSTAGLTADALIHGEDNPTAAAPMPTATTRCLVCQAPDPMGTVVCPSCVGSSDRNNTLIVINPTNRRRRKDVMAALGAIMPVGTSRGALEALATGHGSLVRVPAEAAERTIEHLADRGIPARAVPAGGAWLELPKPYYALLGLILAAGIAGATAVPLLVWTTPAMVVLLGIAGQQRMRKANMPARLRGQPANTPAEERALETIAALSNGTAQELLADFVRVARASTDLGDRSEIMEAAREAAEDLANVDETLAVLDANRGRSVRSEHWWDTVSRFEHARQRLVQQLLDALATLGRANLLPHAEDSARALAEIVEALGARAEIEADARREVELLLSS